MNPRRTLALGLVVGVAVLLASSPAVGAKTSATQTCSLTTSKNDFSIIVRGQGAWQVCRTLHRAWRANSPSSFAKGNWQAKGGSYKQFGTYQVCDARKGSVRAAVWDSGLGFVADDVCKYLVRAGWRVREV